MMDWPKVVGLEGSVAENDTIRGELVGKAYRQGHGNATTWAGAGAALGGMLGSFRGKWLAAVGGLVGAFLGYLVGEEVDK